MAGFEERGERGVRYPDGGIRNGDGRIWRGSVMADTEILDASWIHRALSQ